MANISSGEIKVVQLGCGVIGCGIARLALTKPNLDIVGAIGHIHNVGRDLGEVAGIDQKLGVVISDDTDTVLKQAQPDIVLHATGSILEDVYPQLEKVVKYGINIISTCEQLAYPHKKQASLGAAIDELAKKYNPQESLHQA